MFNQRTKKHIARTTKSFVERRILLKRLDFYCRYRSLLRLQMTGHFTIFENLFSHSFSVKEALLIPLCNVVCRGTEDYFRLLSDLHCIFFWRGFKFVEFSNAYGYISEFRRMMPVLRLHYTTSRPPAKCDMLFVPLRSVHSSWFGFSTKHQKPYIPTACRVCRER